MNPILVIMMAVISSFWASISAAAEPSTGADKTDIEFIRVGRDRHFVGANSNYRFLAWGFNYDHDASGRLLEDYWNQEWPNVVQDFNEMKALGANVVRIHLQVGKFMMTPKEPNQASLNQLKRLLVVAEKDGIYLDITGLGCYRKADVPKWYDKMNEAERWEVQARFWEAVAKTCVNSPAVFCYNIMNEPIVAGDKSEWLTGELGGFYFVQRITLDLASRTSEQVCKAWIDKLVSAIKKHDNHHMVTLGDIPWGLTFKGAKPLFFSKDVSERLDFVSVHFYPKQGEVDDALKVLADYNIGKPIVIEEIFPLSCSLEEIDKFIDGSRGIADGWIGFYWGKTIDEYNDTNFSDMITKNWLKYFAKKTDELLGVSSRSQPNLINK